MRVSCRRLAALAGIMPPLFSPFHGLTHGTCPDVTCRALSRLVGVCRDRSYSTRHHRSGALAIARSEWIEMGNTISKYVEEAF
jgi:hypothetical protein